MRFNNDADIETAEWIEQADRLFALESQGICTHQSAQGRGNGKGPLPGGFYTELEKTIPAGHLKCAGCGKLFTSTDEWLDSSNEALL
jgi:hypothetical protein